MSKRALFIAGGWDGHEPLETSNFMIEEIKKFNIESEIVQDLEVLADLKYLQVFDIILPVWTMGKIDDNKWEIKNSKLEIYKKQLSLVLVLHDGMEECLTHLETIQTINFLSAVNLFAIQEIL